MPGTVKESNSSNNEPTKKNKEIKQTKFIHKNTLSME